MKIKLYAIGVLLCAILLLGTAGAMELGNLTFNEGLWQIAISVTGGLWLWNLLRIEETRAAKKRF